jgi:O-antigen ligase
VAGLALLVRQLATSPGRRRKLGLVFAFTSLAVIAAMLVVFGIGTGERFGTAGALNANGVGRLAAMGMLMLAISSAELGRRSMLSPLNLSLFLALGVGLLLTQSRGSMLAALGAALTIALAQPRVHHRLIGVTACLLLGAGLVFTAMKLDPQAMEQRWQSTFESRDLAGATAGRSEIARTAHLILKDHWIAGIGAGQFAYAYQEYSIMARSRYHNSSGASAHSGYLRIPTEGGVVATLLLIGFYVTLWRGASRLPPGQRRAVARAIIVYMLIGLASSEGIEKENWLAVGLLLIWFWENRVFGHSGVQAFRRSGVQVPSD